MKRGTPNHPKVYALMSLLKISRPTAVGYLELLWHFTSEYAPDGWLSRFSVARIEAAMEWRGGSGRLVAGMWGVGFLDADTHLGFCVHDWHEHADGVVHKKLKRSNKCFVQLTSKVTASFESLTSGIESLTEEMKSLTTKWNPHARALPCLANTNTYIGALSPTTPAALSPIEEDQIPIEGRNGELSVGKVKRERKIFTPPTIEEVQAYSDECGLGINVAKFWHHHNANGWKRGKAMVPIQNWKSCVQTWAQNKYDSPQPSMFNSRPAEEPTTLFVPKPRPVEDDGPDDEPWDLDSMFRAGEPQ